MTEKKPSLIVVCKNMVGSCFADRAEESGDVEEVRVCCEESIEDGYDIYLVHLDDLSDDGVKRLRRQNPESKIVGFSGGRVPKSIESCFDSFYLSTKLAQRLPEVWGGSASSLWDDPQS
jgi:hypothetical protein